MTRARLYEPPAIPIMERTEAPPPANVDGC